MDKLARLPGLCLELCNPDRFLEVPGPAARVARAVVSLEGQQQQRGYPAGLGQRVEVHLGGLEDAHGGGYQYYIRLFDFI